MIERYKIVKFPAKRKEAHIKIAIVVGTRPEIIKMSPVVRACQKHGVEFDLIDTKQHYSDNMSGKFFEDLALPKPSHTFTAPAGVPSTHGNQIGSMLAQFETIFNKTAYDTVLVQGDTNTVLSASLMASRKNIPIGHVEAGLRSYDRTMPEEVNRIMVDHMAEYPFTPSEEASQVLRKEGIPEDKIWNTGNTIVDATLYGSELVKAKPPKLEFDLPAQYALVTMHRPANVDDPKTLKSILSGVEAAMRKFALAVVFPVHPRTRKNIEAAGITLPKGFTLVEPQGYFEFLRLQANASLIMTDSGGVQEEACILHVPCVTLRNNTERPETIAVGANVLGGTHKHSILEAVHKILPKKGHWTIPYGDGKTGEQIIRILQKPLTPALSTVRI